MDSAQTTKPPGTVPAAPDGGENDRHRGYAAGALRVATAFARKYSDDDVSLFAMSLTYTTILSMVPLLAVAFSVLKAFGVHDQVEPLLAQSLAPLGPEGVWLGERIMEFVRNMQVGVLGAAGVAGLFYTVVMLVASVENALNRIWRAREGRSWSSKFSEYLSVIMVGPVLVFTALALTASAQQYELVQRAFALAPWLLWLGTAVVPYVIMAAGFTLLYRFMPNTTVHWPAALAGGVVAGIAWKWAGAAFTAFVASSSRYAAIYSGFAILILFFLWVYVSWSIVLLGAQIAYLWQHPRDVVDRLRRATIAGREAIGLTILQALTRSHIAGSPPAGAAAVAAEAGLPTSTVEEVLDLLVRHGILLEAQRPPGYALARPPESIGVFEVLCVLRGEAPAENGTAPAAGLATAAVAAALRIRTEAARAALRDITLQSLVNERGSADAAAPADQTTDVQSPQHPRTDSSSS